MSEENVTALDTASAPVTSDAAHMDGHSIGDPHGASDAGSAKAYGSADACESATTGATSTTESENKTSHANQPTHQADGNYKTTMKALIASVFFTYIAQNMLNVSIAPLARELHLVEWAIGMAVSLAALFVMSLSQFWGRRSTVWGPRRVMILSLLLALAAGLIFCASVWARSAGLLAAWTATTLIIAARGPFFGSAISAVSPTAQALIASTTPSEQERVKGMSRYSGAVNISIMVGSLVSSALGSWWIFGPVYATPVFVLIALVLAWVFIPHARADSVRKAPLPPKVSWLDKRILPWIASGFGVFFTGGVVQIIAGFVAQDRLNLTPQQAMPVTGGMLLAIAGGAMFAQLIVVPRLAWPARRLMRIGLILDAGFLTLMLFSDSVVALALASLGVGFAAGMAGVGFNAGGTLAVSKEEFGGAAGVLNAASAVTWIFAPVLATALYGYHPSLPFALCLVLLSASLLVALFHPMMKPHSPIGRVRKG